MLPVIPSPESSDLWLRRSGRTAVEGEAGASHRLRLSEAGIIPLLSRSTPTASARSSLVLADSGSPAGMPPAARQLDDLALPDPFLLQPLNARLAHPHLLRDGAYRQPVFRQRRHPRHLGVLDRPRRPDRLAVPYLEQGLER